MGIYTTMYLGPAELGGPDTTARNGWSGLRRSKALKGEPWRGGGSLSKAVQDTDNYNFLQTAYASKHNVNFEGVAGAVKFYEFMKRKAKRNSNSHDFSKTGFTQPRKNKMNTKYMGSHMTYSGTDFTRQTYRLS